MAESRSIYLKYETIPGQSTDSQHKEWVEIDSFSWGGSNSGAMFAAGGGGSQGKSSFHDLNYTATTNKSSPVVLLSCLTGKHIPSVILECVRTGDQVQTYYKVELKDVMITSYQSSGSGASPQEAVTLQPVEVHMAFNPQNQKTGAIESAIKAAYNFREAKKL